MIKKGSIVKTIKTGKDFIHKSYVADIVTINHVTFYKVAAIK